MKISIILGTRPEIIKMSPVIRKCIQENLDFFILHTGQHYSYNMDKIFLTKLYLPTPKYNLKVGPGTPGEQIGKMIIEIEKILTFEKPNIVLLQGDTNTVLAGSIAASKMNIRIGHIEAGIRSYDKTMPEEINRTLTDHVSDYLFAPTKQSKKNLLKEGIPKEKIFVTGNTIVDAIYENLSMINLKKNDHPILGLTCNNYILATIHRQENVEKIERLTRILMGLKRIKKKFNLAIIFPLHPRTKKKMNEFGLNYNFLNIIEPIEFLDFLKLESKARLIMTDSGGVQEESCILGIPCITLRDNTERPETIKIGSNILAGIDSDKIEKCVNIMLHKKTKWIHPFGNGKAANNIIGILKRLKI